MKKKVLVVSDYYLPHWTGIVKTVAYMNNEIQRWFDVTVLTTRFDKKLKKEDKINNVKVVRSPVLFSLSRARVSPSFFIKFLQLAPQSDIVFISSPSLYMTYAAVFAKLFGKKLYVFHQGDLTLPKGFGNWLIERFFDSSCFLSCAFSDNVFCATTDYAKNSRILRYFMKKFKVLPILVKTQTQRPVFNAKMKKVSALKKEGYAIFGFAGRFVEEKGFDILLRAIPEIVRKNPRVHFVFAGNLNISYEDFFEKNKSLYQSVESHITATGVLKDGELEGFYDLIDAVVIPSRSDCFPTVQIEAVIRKKPSIVTDIPGARVIVKETGFGIVVEPENSAQLAQAILDMAKQKEKHLKFYHNVQRYFNLKRDARTVRKYLEG